MKIEYRLLGAYGEHLFYCENADIMRLALLIKLPEHPARYHVEILYDLGERGVIVNKVFAIDFLSGNPGLPSEVKKAIGEEIDRCQKK